MFLVKHNIPVLEHPPYSPDLAPCDFYLFPKVKSALKGTRFETVEAVKEKAARIMKELTEEDFQYCLEQWKFRMERCRDRAGVYFYKTTLQRTIYNSNEGFVVLEELSEGQKKISNKDFFLNVLKMYSIERKLRSCTSSQIISKS
jgi:hypothetical protein